MPDKKEAVQFFKDAKFDKGFKLFGHLTDIVYVEFKRDIDKLESYADKAAE